MTVNLTLFAIEFSVFTGELFQSSLKLKISILLKRSCIIGVGSSREPSGWKTLLQKLLFRLWQIVKIKSYIIFHFFSKGRALLELGRAENLLDEKRRSKSHDFDFRSASTNPSAETTLLRLLVSPDDVSFDGLDIHDFGVRTPHPLWFLNPLLIFSLKTPCFIWSYLLKEPFLDIKKPLSVYKWKFIETLLLLWIFVMFKTIMPFIIWR